MGRRGDPHGASAGGRGGAPARRRHEQASATPGSGRAWRHRWHARPPRSSPSRPAARPRRPPSWRRSPSGCLPAPELEGRFALFGLRRIGELAALTAFRGRGSLRDARRRAARPRPWPGRSAAPTAPASANGYGPRRSWTRRSSTLEPLRFVLHHLRRRPLRAARRTRCRCRPCGPGARSRRSDPANGSWHTRSCSACPPHRAGAARTGRPGGPRGAAPRGSTGNHDADCAGRPPGPRAGRPRPAGRQPARPLHAAVANAARLDWQLASLAIRFGATSLWRVGLGDPEAALPEARTAWTPAGEGPAATSEAPTAAAVDGPVPVRQRPATRRRTSTR